MKRCLAAMLIGSALVMLGCGDDDQGRVDVSGGTNTTGTSTEAASPAGPVVETIEVAATEFRFSPANPSLSKAGVVEFNVTNDGKIGHALEVEGPDGEVETDTISPGKTATLKADLNKPGRYEWYCPIGDHEDRGMKGEITVAGEGGQNKEDREAGPDGHGGY